MSDLADLLHRAPWPAPLPLPDDAIADSTRYLASDAAARSLARDTYWPKWDSPWWHMLLVHELGEARRIPERAVRGMVDGLAALRVKLFPIRADELPPGADVHRDTTCHCALGSMHQVLSACGVDVARELPWIEPWFARYQMPDGGLSCDAEAYLVEGECPSSMVGTIAPFEAMLERPDARPFVDAAARFLVERQLVRGSASAHNAVEREVAPSWLLPAFPRFYFYDVLRGLAALVRWADTTASPLPHDAIAVAVAEVIARAPDGVVRVQRRAFDGRQTLAPAADGTWQRQPATSFPLLDATSVIGARSPSLTAQWTQTRRALLRLLDAGRVTDGPAR